MGKMRTLLSLLESNVTYRKVVDLKAAASGALTGSPRPGVVVNAQGGVGGDPQQWTVQIFDEEYTGDALNDPVVSKDVWAKNQAAAEAQIQIIVQDYLRSYPRGWARKDQKARRGKGR